MTGHELLKNAWLEANGKIPKRGIGLSTKNPAIALRENPIHKFISGQQKSLGLNKKNLAGTSWHKNVLYNILLKLKRGEGEKNFIGYTKKKGDIVMSDIWKNVIQFLVTTNGESKDRADYVITPKAEQIQRKLAELEPVWEVWMNSLGVDDRKQVGAMKDYLEEFASVMEQRAYIQGYIDCVQILSKISLLKKENE